MVKSVRRAGVAVWKSVTSVAVALFLALAALTRNPNWAAAIRVLTGLWLVAAPYLLNFRDVAPALLTYLLAGAAVTAVAVAGLTTRPAGRIRLVGVSNDRGIPWHLA